MLSLIGLEQLPVPEESSEEEDYANGESDDDEDEKEVRAYKKKKKRQTDVCKARIEEKKLTSVFNHLELSGYFRKTTPIWSEYVCWRP